MLPNRGSTRCLRAAGTGTDGRLPRWRFIHDRRPRLLTFRPSSVLLFPVSPSSRYFLLSGPVRPPGGRYLSDAGSVRSAPVGRANMLPSRGSTRCLRAAGSGTDSRLPRWHFTNDRRPRLLTLPSIVRPPLSRGRGHRRAEPRDLRAVRRAGRPRSAHRQLAEHALQGLPNGRPAGSAWTPAGPGAASRPPRP